MNALPVLAVLDIGKTHVKLILLEKDGIVCHSVKESNPVEPGGLYPHAGVDRIWEWLVESLSSFSSTFEVQEIICCTHGATAVLLNQGGELALPVLDYEFDGVESYNYFYEKERSPFSETFSPSLPGGLNIGRQLYWQQKEFPQEFSEVSDILLYPQYWAWKLSGIKASEVTSLGCHTDLWNPREKEFSSLAKKKGWASLFPPLRLAWENLGGVEKGLVDKTGLSPQGKVFCGIHDSNASYYRHRSAREGSFSVLSTGTWVICMAANQSVDSLDESRDTLANVDAYGEPVATSRFMGGREFEVIAGKEGTQISLEQKDIAALIQDRVWILPSFTNQGGPFRFRKRDISAFESHSPRSRAALGTLYCVLVSDYCLDLIGAEGDLIIEGSFVNNSFFCHLMATLRPSQNVFLSHDDTGTVRGTSMLTGWPGFGKLLLDSVPSLRPFPGLEGYRKEWRQLCEK